MEDRVNFDNDYKCEKIQSTKDRRVNFKGEEKKKGKYKSGKDEWRKRREDGRKKKENYLSSIEQRMQKIEIRTLLKQIKDQ